MFYKNNMATKKSLAVALSKIKGYAHPKLHLEQYETESELASSILWHALLRNDIENKIICDLGAGTGILGIGALMLEAERVIFVEKDNDALAALKENVEEYDESFYEILNIDVSAYDTHCDTVIMNPPFGAQNRHADRPFLEAAFRNANATYTILPSVSEEFYVAFAKEHGMKMTVLERTGFRMKKNYSHQNKPMAKIAVIIALFNKQS
jgi:putative methylase